MFVTVVLSLVLVAAPNVVATNKRTFDGDLGDHFLPNCLNSCVTHFFAKGPGEKRIEMQVTYADYLLCNGCSGPVSDIFTAEFEEGTATIAFEADTTEDSIRFGLGDAPVKGMTFKLQAPHTCTTEEQEITGVYVSDDDPGTCGDLKQTCANDGVTTALSVNIDTWCSCPGGESKRMQTVVKGSAFESCPPPW